MLQNHIYSRRLRQAVSGAQGQLCCASALLGVSCVWWTHSTVQGEAAVPFKASIQAQLYLGIVIVSLSV